jgi:hypothetical protein
VVRTHLAQDWDWSSILVSALINGRYLGINICCSHSLGSDWLRTGGPRVRRSNPDRVKNYLSSTLSRPTLVHPFSYLKGALSPGLKRQAHEPGHSP